MKKLALFFMIVMIFSACGNNVENTNSNIEQIINSGEKVEIVESAPKEDVLKKLEQMSLKDKIEQMLILDYSMVPYGQEGQKDVTTLADSMKDTIANHNFGGIILFRDNTKGTIQTQKLVYDFQNSATNENNKYKIPLFMCIDQEGGSIIRLATGTSMPGNMAIGAINDYETTKEYAEVIGNELNVLGFNVDFAPVLDVNSNPSNPIIGVRSFSSDKDRVAKMGEAFIEGLHSQNVASTLKHFPGHGDTATDSHTGLPLIDKSYEDIKNTELVPFKAGIDKGADMIMTAHIVYPQIEKEKYISKKTKEEISLPATLSKTILTDILRNDLGFDGIIVTDALNMGAIADHFEKTDVVKYAINAGVDILLMPVSLSNGEDSINQYVDNILKLIENGDINEDTINESVTRVLKLKQKLGLFDNDYEYTEEHKDNALKIVGSKENHDKELKIAKDAITLVKGKELLPINKEDKVLFLNAYENVKNNIEYAIKLLKEDNVIDDLFDYEIDSYEKKDILSLKDKISNANIVVITTETTISNSFNNNKENGWQGRFIDKAIEEIHKQNKKVILVSCMLPYDVSRYDKADAILCAYGNRVIPSLSFNYDGEVATFGQNISAGIMRLFDNGEFKATLPVDVYKINNNYEYTKDILYSVK